MKGRKHIRPQNKPPETALIQRWIDQVLDFPLSGVGWLCLGDPYEDP